MKNYTKHQYYKQKYDGNYYKIKGTVTMPPSIFILSEEEEEHMICDIMTIIGWKDGKPVYKLSENHYIYHSVFDEDNDNMVKVTEEEWNQVYEEMQKTSIL